MITGTFLFILFLVYVLGMLTVITAIRTKPFWLILLIADIVILVTEVGHLVRLLSYS